LERGHGRDRRHRRGVQPAVTSRDLQGDLGRAPEYWPNLLSCIPLGGSDSEAFAWTYRLGRHKVTGTATRTVAEGRLSVRLEGGIRGRIEAEYTPTAMTRTRILLRVDAHAHRGIVGRAVDRMGVYKQLKDDLGSALANFGVMLERETWAIIGELADYLDAPSGERSPAIRVVDAGGVSVLCPGPGLDQLCSLLPRGPLVCAGGRVIPAAGAEVEGWALEAPPERTTCPLAWILQPPALTA
jgi:hypothetical protein